MLGTTNMVSIHPAVIDDEDEVSTCPYDICDGSGEIITMERVYPGEPHMAPIGTKICLCKKQEKEYEPED